MLLPLSHVFVLLEVYIDLPLGRLLWAHTTSLSFQMKMKDAWINVLDVIDDILIVHSVDWDDDDDACKTDVSC